MKKILLTAFILINFNVQGQILNPSFETWTAGLPDNWWGLMIPGFNLISQSPQSHTGSSAASLSVVDIGGGFPATSLLATGDGIGTTHPLSIVPGSFSFWYRFTPVNQDKLIGAAVVYSGGNGVGAGSFSFGASATYTMGSVNILYGPVPPTADSIALYFIISNDTGQVSIGSNALVDDVSISVNAGVGANNEPEAFTISPNPANEYLSIKFNIPVADAMVSLTDASGKKAFETKTSSSLNIPASNLKEGVYICTIRNNNDLHRKVVIVKH